MLIRQIPCRLSRSIFNSTFRKSPAITALSLNVRQKSTNQSKKSTQNLQQSALKLEPTAECPPKPPKTAVSSGSSDFDGSHSDPSSNDGLKWILIGGVVIAMGGGYVMYNSTSHDTDIATDKPAKTEKKVGKFRSPPTSKDIPKHVPYLLIGGGTASFAAFRAIKSNEPKAKIMVVSDEPVMPYMRPPLSKEIWFDTELGLEKARFKQWNAQERSLYYEPEEFYMSAEKLGDAVNGGVSVIRGYSVVKLNVNEQKVTLDDGTEVTYDKCLLATGSSPKSIDVFDRASPKVRERILTYKSIKDFEALKEKVEKSKSIAVVGNGFLGSELSCALAHYGKDGSLKVVQLFNENGNMAKVLPEYLSKWTTDRIQEVGVDVQPNSQIIDVETYEGNQVRIKLSNGKSIVVDHIVQAVGSRPNVSLADESGLEVDPRFGGFVVNAELEARSNLYSAGDVACFYDPRFGRRRVEHHDHAVVSGRLAGENMVGLQKPYKHQSMFWSDLGTAVGYEAIGLVDSTLPTVAVFAKPDPNDLKRVPYDEKAIAYEGEAPKKPLESDEKETPKPSAPAQSAAKEVAPSKSSPDTPDNFGKGVIFYMQGDKIVGILLWNVFNRISIARKILMCDETFKDLNEVAKLFDIFEQQNQDKQN